MDHLQGDAPLGDHPGGHRGVDAAGEEAHRPAADAHRQAARPGLGVGVDKSGVVPDLQVDGEVGGWCTVGGEVGERRRAARRPRTGSAG